LAKESDCGFAEKDAHRSRKRRSQGCTQQWKPLKLKSVQGFIAVDECFFAILSDLFSGRLLRELDLLRFLPRPPQPFFRPPLSDLFTVAYAPRSASLLLTRAFVTLSMSCALPFA
jgi:hypothetical protein